MKSLLTTTTTLLLALATTGACAKEDPEHEQAKTAEATEMTATPKPAAKVASQPSVKPSTHREAATKMTERGFAIHTRASADAKTDASFQFYEDTIKFVPNLGGVMAESPVLMNSYLALQQNLQAYGALTPPENNIVQMSIAMENECQYCVAGHTLAGKIFFKSPDEQLEALRKKAALSEPKLNALRDFGLQVYASKGRISDKELKNFLDAGYSRAQALDVVANIAAKVMSNYTNQLARTPLDPQAADFAEGLPFAEERQTLSIPN